MGRRTAGAQHRRAVLGNGAGTQRQPDIVSGGDEVAPVWSNVNTASDHSGDQHRLLVGRLRPGRRLLRRTTPADAAEQPTRRLQRLVPRGLAPGVHRHRRRRHPCQPRRRARRRVQPEPRHEPRRASLSLAAREGRGSRLRAQRRHHLADGRAARSSSAPRGGEGHEGATPRPARRLTTRPRRGAGSMHPTQPMHPTQSMQSAHPTHAMHPRQRRQASVATQTRMPAPRTVSALPATPMLPAVTAVRRPRRRCPLSRRWRRRLRSLR